MSAPAPQAGPTGAAPRSQVAAVIDVGTNSVKLLVGRRGSLGMEPMLEESQTTRLGRGFYPHCRLMPEAIADTARAVGGFAASAKRLGAERIKVVATSAAREATNPQDFLSAVQDVSGLDVEIISGDREALLAFKGATAGGSREASRVMVVDVGGGSTEFILGSGGEPSIQHSFPVGVVRLHEAGQWGDPPSPAEAANCRAEVRRFLTSEVAPKFRDVQMGAGADRCRLVGVGGSATVMAAMELQLEKFDRVRIEGIELSRAMVDAWERRLWGMSHDARCNVRGLPPARADVILAGVSIYSAILETFGFDRVTVTTRGLRYALMEEMT